MRQQQLIVEALKDKIVGKDVIIAANAKKCANYDEITAQAVKANIAMNTCKGKAQVR